MTPPFQTLEATYENPFIFLDMQEGKQVVINRNFIVMLGAVQHSPPTLIPEKEFGSYYFDVIIAHHKQGGRLVEAKYYTKEEEEVAKKYVLDIWNELCDQLGFVDINEE